MKIIRNILFTIMILGGIVLITAILISRFYEDEITRYAINGINRQIKTQINVESVKLSLLKKFPDASLEFKNVFVRSVPEYNDSEFSENTDTLLFAERLYLQFDVLRIFRQQYLLKEVQLQSGILRVLTDRTGGTNYEFWTGHQGEKEFLLELNNVRLSDMQLNYVNHAMDIESFSQIHKTYMRGRFSESEYRLNFGLEGKISKHSKEGIVFVKNQSIVSSASLNVSAGLIDIESGMIELAGQNLLVEGSIQRGTPLGFELSAKGARLNLENILHYVASANSKIPENLQAGGELSFEASIKGEGSKSRMPGIEAIFSISNGWIRTGKGGMEIKQIRSRGTYSNGIAHSPATTSIELHNTSLQYGNSRMGGSFFFKNLTEPTINHNFKLELDLSDLQDIISRDSLIMDMKGMLIAELKASGKQSSLLEISREELLGIEFEARLRFEKAGFRLSRPPLECRDLSGEMIFGDYLQIGTINGSFGDNYLSFSGRGDNVKEFLLTDHGNLWLDLDVYSDKADLSTLLKNSPELANNEYSDTIRFPERIYLKSRFWFDEFVLRDFSASNVMGDLFYKPGRLTLNNINLSSMDGLIKAEGLIEQQSEFQYLAKVISDISRVDIKKGFTSFHNFGQDFITDSHLKGSLSGKVHFSAVFNKKMKIQKESILSDCDIVIRNGELSGFEPMQKLSRFIEVEELENVSFSTLTNQIFIRNQEVLIPRMDINSSAFEIAGSGAHGFDKNFEYKVKVSLSELLSGKVNKPDRQAEEFGAIEDDGLGRAYLYLIINGSPEGIDIKYDRRAAILNIRDQLQEEKIEVREILNREFGLFKKDSLLFREDENQDRQGFIIEWEEETIPDSLKKDALKKDNKTKGSGFTIRWEEDEEIDTMVVEKKKRKGLFKKRD